MPSIPRRIRNVTYVRGVTIAKRNFSSLCPAGRNRNAVRCVGGGSSSKALGMSSCPTCRAKLVRRDACYHWRGVTMHGWVCTACNSLWDLKGAFVKYVAKHSHDRDAFCPTCKRFNFHWGGCADQNALADYPYGQHPIPYPEEDREKLDDVHVPTNGNC